VTTKYEFIDAQKAEFTIVKMCEWAEVSRSGYYEWRDRPTSATATRREHLKILIKEIFELSDQTYGYRRVHAQLVRQGEQVSDELVRAPDARARPHRLPAQTISTYHHHTG
jgi:hypothetical protein